MSHTTKVRLAIIAWLLGVGLALYLDYVVFDVEPFVVFIQGYAARGLWNSIEEYANQYWRY